MDLYDQDNLLMNKTDETPQEIPIDQQHLKIAQLVHITAGLVEIAAQIFLITVISCNKNLKTKTNISVLHLTIVGTLYYSISISFAFLGTFATLRSVRQALFFCSESTMLMLYLTFATLMALDWFISSFMPKVEEKYRKYEKHVYYFIYLVGFLKLSISMFFSNTHLIFLLFLLNVVYATLLVLLIVLNVLKRMLKPAIIDNSSTEYSLVVSNIVMFSMLPCLIANVIIIYVLKIPFVLLCFILYIFWLTHPLIVLCTLGSSNKDFKEACRTILRRRQKKTEDGCDMRRNNEKDRQSESVV